MCNSYSSMRKSSLYVPLKKVMNYGVEIFESLENIDLICIDGIEQVIYTFVLTFYKLFSTTILITNILFIFK